MRWGPGGRRLIPESPPLATLFSALTLFTEAFQNGRSGSRLIFVARPPLLSYGFYGASGAGSDPGADALNRLMVARSRIAELVDCFMRYDCSADTVARQIQLDLLVYQLDRVIDLYALADPDTDAEARVRAMALATLVSGYLAPRDRWSDRGMVQGPILPRNPPLDFTNALVSLMQDLGWNIWMDWGGQFRARAPDFYLDSGGGVTVNTPPGPRNPFPIDPRFAGRDQIFTDVAETLHSELCAMLEVETGWNAMVSALAPSCVRDDVMRAPLYGGATGSVGRQLIEQGKVEVEFYLLTRRICVPFTVSIPPNLETSLDAIANDTPANGLRP